MEQFNIDSALKITKVTENAYVYPQVTLADEDMCLAFNRKWADIEEPYYKRNGKI